MAGAPSAARWALRPRTSVRLPENRLEYACGTLTPGPRRRCAVTTHRRDSVSPSSRDPSTTQLRGLRPLGAKLQRSLGHVALSPVPTPGAHH